VVIVPLRQLTDGKPAGLLDGTGGRDVPGRPVPDADAGEDDSTSGPIEPSAGPPPRAGAGARARRWLSGRLPGWQPRLVAMVAIISGVVAAVVSTRLFPHLSMNNDEGIYRLQAQVFVSGHLFPPAADPAASYTPWLAVLDGSHYVLKYTPLVPGLLALSLWATGGYWAVLAVLATAFVVVTYLLAVELLGDRTVAAVAAVLTALSPLVIIQSGLLLPYLPTALLLELFALLLARGVRAAPSQRPKLFAGAGVAAGLALTVRPFDGVLFIVPVLAWALFGPLRRTATRRRAAAWLIAGAVLPLLGLAAWNWAATGSPTRLPFALLEKRDALGFGIRKLYPTDNPHNFHLADGWSGVAEHLRLLGLWTCGGVVLAALAVVALVRRRVRAPAVALFAGGLLLSAGYLFFWGVWNAAKNWAGISYVGPFYVLAVLVPLVLVGAVGLVDLFRWRPLVAVATTAGCLAMTGVVLAGAVATNATFTDQNEQLSRLTADGAQQKLVFVAADPSFLMHPTSVLANPPDIGSAGPVYALARGSDDFGVLRRFPAWDPYLLRMAGDYGHSADTPVRAVIERLSVERGATLRLRLHITPPAGARYLYLKVTAGSVRYTYPLDPSRGVDLILEIDAAGVRIPGRPPALGEVLSTPSQPVLLTLEGLGKHGTVTPVDGMWVPVRALPGADPANPPQVEAIVPVEEVGRLGSLPGPALVVRPA